MILQKVSNISSFLKKHEKLISFRVNQVEAWVERTGKTEKFVGAEHDVEKVRIGVIGELLTAFFLRGKLVDEVNGIWDLETLDFRKIDAKTVKVRSNCSLKSIESIKNYNFYLEASQLRVQVDYTFVYINFEEDTAIIIDSPLLKGDNIYRTIKPVLENPPNTNRGTEVNWNYKIYLKPVFEDLLRK